MRGKGLGLSLIHKLRAGTGRGSTIVASDAANAGQGLWGQPGQLAVGQGATTPANSQYTGHLCHSAPALQLHGSLSSARAFSSSAVKQAQPPPVFAVSGLSEGPSEASDDLHEKMTPKSVVELLDK